MKLSTLFIICLLVITSCNNKKADAIEHSGENTKSISQEKEIKKLSDSEMFFLGKWQYDDVFNENGESVKKILPGDEIYFVHDHTFYYYIYAEGIYATGVWSLLGDSIMKFTYDAVPKKEAIDTVECFQGEWRYYLKGKIVKTLFLDSCESQFISRETVNAYSDSNAVNNYTREYIIQSKNKNAFTMSEKGVYFSFSKLNI